MSPNLFQAVTAAMARRFNPRVELPDHGNPWPDGVAVEWVKRRGWVPCFDVDANELLSDFHTRRFSRGVRP